VPGYPPLPQPGQANPYGQPQGPQFPSDLRDRPAREPDWTENGSYCVVRASTLDLARWDRETLGTQQHVIGRFKVSGASLDIADESDRLDQPPAFQANPGDTRVPINAHVRKANPRATDDLARRIFRRGYPLIEATVDELRRGLIFICFARSISTQFEFITRGWLTNENFPNPGAGVDPLRSYERVLCGGYFFIPPVTSANRPESWVLPPAPTA
jgi:deferrochelatase/peroxidase EfeB